MIWHTKYSVTKSMVMIHLVLCVKSPWLGQTTRTLSLTREMRITRWVHTLHIICTTPMTRHPKATMEATSKFPGTSAFLLVPHLTRIVPPVTIATFQLMRTCPFTSNPSICRSTPCQPKEAPTISLRGVLPQQNVPLRMKTITIIPTPEGTLFRQMSNTISEKGRSRGKESKGGHHADHSDIIHQVVPLRCDSGYCYQGFRAGNETLKLR